MKFDYLIEKLNKAKIVSDPFEYVVINDFLNEKDFNSVVNNEKIRIAGRDDKHLVESLMRSGYESLDFPGCTPNPKKYLKFRRQKRELKSIYDGLGFAVRLNDLGGVSALSELYDFFGSEKFVKSVLDKFNIVEPIKVDTGLQKYLSGYQIAPHPDVRSKAATWMLNLNTFKTSDKEDIHTHLMKFSKKYQYIYEFWKNNTSIDRAWVPWEWCETVVKTSRNNSIVLFSPSDYSLHAVRLDYNHLENQRTQFYGNLWYTDEKYLKLRYAKCNYLDLITPIENNVPYYVKKNNHSSKITKRLFNG